MSELPKLIPVTRREPPPGHRQPDYKALEFIGDSLQAPPSMTDDHEDAERRWKAKQAVSAAMSRSAWHPLSILLWVRLMYQALRLKLRGGESWEP